MTRSMQVQFHNRPATQPLTVRDDWSIDGRRMGEIILQSNPTIQRPNRTVRSVQHNDSGGLSSAISIQGMHQSTRYIQVADSEELRVIIILCMPYLVIIVN